MSHTTINVDYLVTHINAKDALHLAVYGGIAYFVYTVVTTLYDVYYGPLSKYPGPKLWAASQIPMAYHTWSGTELAARVKIHETYGPVVRLTPNMLSYTSGQAWKDIYGHRNASTGKKAFPKDSARTRTPINGAESIIVARREEDHARQRKILSHSFSDRALKEQEPLLKQWAGLLTDKLELKAERKEPVDMVAYYNFTTFDIMADLTFGEPFYMLENERYNSYVTGVFDNIRTGVRVIALRQVAVFSMIIDFILKFSNRIRQAQVDHFNFSKDRVDKRLANPPNKYNIWTEVLRRAGKDNENMSLAEMHSNSALFLVAGTETTATLLSGLTYHLLRHPPALQTLTHELRTHIPSPAALTLENLARLPYLHACLEEGMRIYPPAASALNRVVPSPGHLIAGAFVPPGTKVGVAQLAAHRARENWRAPDVFAPERWLARGTARAYPPANEGTEGLFEEGADDHGAFQPFSTGPRNCIGKNLAYHEARVLLASVLWGFDLELVEEEQGKEGEDWLDQRAFIVWEKKPLMCRVTRAAGH